MADYSSKYDYHGIPVTTYPDEFMPLLKVINRAMLQPELFGLTDKELELISEYQTRFADVCFEYGVTN